MSFKSGFSFDDFKREFIGNYNIAMSTNKRNVAQAHFDHLLETNYISLARASVNDAYEDIKDEFYGGYFSPIQLDEHADPLLTQQALNKYTLINDQNEDKACRYFLNMMKKRCMYWDFAIYSELRDVFDKRTEQLCVSLALEKEQIMLQATEVASFLQEKWKKENESSSVSTQKKRRSSNAIESEAKPVKRSRIVPYAVGTKVMYVKGNIEKNAIVNAVHHDDAPNIYYTIITNNGRAKSEIQTDHSNLRVDSPDVIEIDTAKSRHLSTVVEKAKAMVAKSGGTVRDAVKRKKAEEIEEVSESLLERSKREAREQLEARMSNFGKRTAKNMNDTIVMEESDEEVVIVKPSKATTKKSVSKAKVPAKSLAKKVVAKATPTVKAKAQPKGLSKLEQAKAKATLEVQQRMEDFGKPKRAAAGK